MCWQVHTKDAVHDLVLANIHQSPLYNGQIQGSVRVIARRSRTRSCGSLHRERHQIFLEPEGLDVDEIYVNGFSMSLPRDVQEAIVRAMPGLRER